MSFRLKLPLGEVERLPVVLARELALGLGRERGEVVLSVTDGDSSLRFRPVGHDAVLTEVAICNDPGGTFFQRVLGPLMVRFGGDCELRLVWNTPDRNTHGDFGAVTIRRGQTNYPGLSQPAQALRNALTASAASEATLGASGQGSSGGAPARSGKPRAPTAEEQAAAAAEIERLLAEEAEIEKLLARGRELFTQYQKQKRQ